MTGEHEQHSAVDSGDAHGDHRRVAGVVRGASAAFRFAGRSAGTVLRRVPRTVHLTLAGASGTTTALQTLPDATLRSVAVGAVGVGAGFYLAGARRVAVVAGVAPAVLMGAAILLRPARRTVGPETVA